MCFDKRKTPVAIICGCSVVAVIFGVLMIVFAFLLTNNKILDQMQQENADIDSARKAAFTLLLIFSLTTIAIAALGFCFRWVKNRCFACIYGIILLPTWIVLIVVGIITLAASVASSDHIEKQCLIYELQSQTQLSSDSNISISLDIYNSLGVNQYMCSEYCPCAPTQAAASWSNMDRTPNFTGDIKTYQGCIEKYANPANQVGTSSFYGFCEEFVGQANYNDIVKWIKFFEDEYDCAGICQPATFYFTQSIDKGRPKSGCITSVKDDITSAFTGLAITTLIAGIFLFFVFIMQYCLWRSY